MLKYGSKALLEELHTSNKILKESAKTMEKVHSVRHNKLKNDPKNYKDMNLFSLVIEIRKASFAPFSALETFRSVVQAAHTFQHDRYRWTLVPSSSMLMMILILRIYIVAAVHLERSARLDNKRTIFYKRDRNPHSSCPKSSRINSSYGMSPQYQGHHQHEA